MTTSATTIPQASRDARPNRARDFARLLDVNIDATVDVVRAFLVLGARGNGRPLTF